MAKKQKPVYTIRVTASTFKLKHPLPWAFNPNDASITSGCPIYDATNEVVCTLAGDAFSEAMAIIQAMNSAHLMAQFRNSIMKATNYDPLSNENFGRITTEYDDEA